MKVLYQEEDVPKDVEQKVETVDTNKLKFSVEEGVAEVNSIDQIYDKVGYNWITMKNIFLTFFVISIEGLHFTLFSNMIIPLREHYKLSEDQVSIISSMLFVFVGIGSFFSGKLAGKFGRPFLINLTLFVVTLLNIFMAISTNWWIFLIFRCLIGFSLGFAIPMSLNLLTEFLPLKLRSFVLNSVWAGFSFGALFLLFIMLYVMPNMEPNKVETTVLLTTLLSFTAFLLNLFLLYDSPRNLIFRNKEKEAFEILEKISGNPIDDATRSRIIKESQKSFQNISFDIKEIFNEKFGKLSLLLTYIWFINSVISYGPAVTSNLTMKAIGKEENFSNNEIIKNQILINVINMLSMFGGGIMTEASYLGRKLSANINFILAFITIILLVIWPNNFAMFFGIYSSLQGITFNILTTYSCEVYPTKIRDHAIGFLFSSTRLGGFTSQILYLYFNSIGIWVPYYATAVFTLINILLVYLLPYDSYGIPLDKEISHRS